MALRYFTEFGSFRG